MASAEFAVLNCPFLIFSASSIPEIVTIALSNSLESPHRPDSLLHSPMVLFHQIVQAGWIELWRGTEAQRLPSSLAPPGASP